MAKRAAVPIDLDSLRRFWREAEIPPERLPYLEFQARRYTNVAELLASAGPLNDARLLDLGGGVGSLAVALHGALGGAYDVADFLLPSPANQAALVRNGVERSFRCDLSASNPLGGVPDGYSVILLVEVLEHLLVNPLLLVRLIAQHLRPGGLLLLTTPNVARLSNRWKLLLGRSIKEPGRYPTEPDRVNGHVIEYTLDELDRILEFESFRCLRAQVVQQVPSPRPSGWQRAGVRVLDSRLLRRWRLGDDIQALYRLLAPEERSIPATPRPERF